jgi:hypothetical protein
MREETLRWPQQQRRAIQCARMIIESTFFVGWFTLALINAGLAQGKNRNGLVWFLLSILFGPLVTLAIVVLPKG